MQKCEIAYRDAYSILFHFRCRKWTHVRLRGNSKACYWCSLQAVLVRCTRPLKPLFRILARSGWRFRGRRWTLPLKNPRGRKWTPTNTLWELHYQATFHSGRIDYCCRLTTKQSAQLQIRGKNSLTLFEMRALWAFFEGSCRTKLSITWNYGPWTTLSKGHRTVSGIESR